MLVYSNGQIAFVRIRFTVERRRGHFVSLSLRCIIESDVRVERVCACVCAYVCSIFIISRIIRHKGVGSQFNFTCGRSVLFPTTTFTHKSVLFHTKSTTFYRLSDRTLLACARSAAYICIPNLCVLLTTFRGVFSGLSVCAHHLGLLARAFKRERERVLRAAVSNETPHTHAHTHKPSHNAHRI